MGIFLSGHRVSFSGVRFMLKSNDVVVTGINQVVLANSAGYNLVDMKIQGNSVQDGTPTPEAPIKIQSVGDKTKNLAEKLFNLNSSGASVSSTILIQQTNKVINSSLIKVEGGQKYVLSRTVQGQDFRCFWFDTKPILGETQSINGAYLAPTQLKSTVTAPDNAKYLFVRWSEGYDAGNVQIEKGETATEYEPYGYKIPISIGGKNLVNVLSDKNTYGYLDKNGNIVSHGAIKYTDFIGVGNATQITFSGMASNGMSAPSTCFYDKNKTFISGVSFAGSGEKTIDIPANARYFRTCFRTSYTQFMAEFGSVATSYVDYLEPTTTNIYLKEPLRMINDVVDVLDYKNKKVIRNVGSVIYNATESWSKYDSGNGYMESNSIFPDGKPVLCNMFVNSQTLIKTLAIRKNYANIYVYGVQDYYPTQAEWHAFLAENNMEVIGQLVTPTEETIDVPTLPTKEGVCVYEILTKVEPTYLEITYKEKT